MPSSSLHFLLPISSSESPKPPRDTDTKESRSVALLYNTSSRNISCRPGDLCKLKPGTCFLKKKSAHPKTFLEKMTRTLRRVKSSLWSLFILHTKSKKARLSSRKKMIRALRAQEEAIVFEQIRSHYAKEMAEAIISRRRVMGKRTPTR